MNQACQWLEDQPLPPSDKITFAIRELLRLLEEDENAARYHLLIFKLQHRHVAQFKLKI